MRETKFRLWNNAGDKSKMFYDTEQVMEYLKQQMLFNDKTHKYHKLGYDHVGDGSSFMQFTGIKDKTGKEIYEGDILRGVQKRQEDKEGVNAYPLVDTVRWSNGGFEVFSKPIQKGYTKEGGNLYQFMWRDSSHHATPAFYYQIDDIEIIGNVHESPELMNGRHEA